MLINLLRAKGAKLFRIDHERSKKIAINIVLSFLVKGLNIIIGLLLIPLCIDYVSPVQYGIWLTLSSIIGWMDFFDIGLGNGLRNKLAQLLASNETSEAKKYVSSTYASLVTISIILFGLFGLINPFINWKYIVNVPNNIPDNLSLL